MADMDNLKLNYPNELPVSEHRHEILTALRRNPVVIVCGDTGSGKTTQLPKMALEARDQEAGIGEREAGKDGKRPRKIAVTQPRRLAAVTMAERVADELGCEVGGLVGYRHRFARKSSPETRIEFMTDGVLLAETRSDPLLRAYDTIIVDEAHERSLNIDFLLGILKRILARRRDLTVIVSSATLDAARFSEFFGHAPVISVPGRLYPIEIAYRPPREDEERDLSGEVADAVQELPLRDDVLVFLPGERDIRETADRLRAVFGGTDDVIPLLASLPAAEQRRAFRLSPRRRIILATNVAETSVTIPGIRAVVDSGLARISRYVHRTQVQRLQIEPISRASANQRAGRCGRIGPGRCLRLYSEEDFASRDAYTPPEVLRSSLAGVILTMLDLRLGEIERFPFIDPPKPTMIREGLRELLELGAIQRGIREQGAGSRREIQLTDIGRKLARIPVEPRLARMLIAGSDNAVLPSVIPIVAALACDDPRRRPIDEKEKADQQHARFRVPGSDFLGTLKMWRWWKGETDGLSQSKARKLCKAAYLSYPKMREWLDLSRQLETLSKALGLFTEQTADESYFADILHKSLLSGLLGRIGHYHEEDREYRGAHGLRFAIHPSSVLAKASKEGKGRFPLWIVAGELVDTSRLFARDTAVINVDWIESVAGPLCARSYHSPEWDATAGFVRAVERVTLYGLVIEPARRCDYSRINPTIAREIFIRRALVDGEFPNPPPDVRENNRLLETLRKRAERMRHPEFFDADKVFAHFDRIVPPDICSSSALRKWLKAVRPGDFRLQKSDWWQAESFADRDFPDSLRIAGKTIRLSYRHTPEDPECDGLTATVRAKDVDVLKLWRSDWLVPGLLPEKVNWMLATLPSALRRVLAPLDQTATILLSMLKPGNASLEDAFRTAVYERWAFRIPTGAWNWQKLPAHLQMRFRILDDLTGKVIACSRNIREVNLSERHSAETPMSASPSSTTWSFGTIPRQQTDRNSSWETISYPALCDTGDGVVLKLYPNPTSAAEAHDIGVARLLYLALEKSQTPTFRRSRLDFEAALFLKEIDYADGKIAADILYGAICETLVRNRPPVRSAEEFAARLGESRATLVKAQSEMMQILAESAAAATRINGQLADGRLTDETVDSISTQLAWLMFPGFLRTIPLSVLRHYKRYLKGVQVRMERARLSPTSDLKKEALLAPYWQRYQDGLRALRQSEGQDRPSSRTLADFRWMLEEYRISLFAQELHTPVPVSPKRLDALLPPV